MAEPSQPSDPRARSEQLLRLLVERVQDYAIFVLDPEGCVTTWNIGAERLKGYRPAEIIGRSFSVFYPPEDVRAGKPAEELRIATRDGRVEDEGWRIRKDGSRFLANVVITALRDPEGRLRGFAKVTRDVTRRFTSAERSLDETDARFRALADNIPQLAWMADSAGKAFWYNKRWLDYAGSTAPELERDGWQRLVHPQHAERVAARLQAAIASGDPWEDSFPIRGRTDGYRWFLTRAVPIRADDGGVKMWFGTGTDISEQRKLQEALEAAVHARDVFLSIASHELRTPLTPLVLQLQSIQRLGEKQGNGSLPSKRVLEKVGRATRQAAHLERLVGDLLDMSLLGEGRLVLNLERVDLTELVADVAARLRPELDLVGSKLEIRASGVLEGSWDRARLEQVVSNLLGHALKFGAGEPVEVEVLPSDGHAILRVREHGIEITPEERERIFGQFERAASEKNYGGFGLGLWISRQVVEAMKGTIAVENMQGNGVTFTVTLPRVAVGAGVAR